MESKAEIRRGAHQLRRLQTLTDVVYALVLWRVFVLLPKPGESRWHWDTLEPYFRENALVFVLIVIGVIYSIIYWNQNNTLTSRLKRTDGRHTALSIAQLFLLLLFLFALRLGVELGGSSGTRALESATAALVGYASVWSWSYACSKRRLLEDDVDAAEARRIRDSILAEPIAATITIPIAFVGPIFWEVSWLSIIIIARFLKRRRTTHDNQ